MKQKQEVNSEFASMFRGVLKNPQKMYYLLMMSGMSGSKAQELLYDLKYPKLRMASANARKKVIKLLTAIINTITSDNMLFSRFLSLARNKNVLGEEGIGSGEGLAGLVGEPPVNKTNLIKYLLKNRKKSKKFDFVNMMTPMQRR